MSELLKTTVYLDRGDYGQLRMLARQQGRAPAELIREAVAEYAHRHRPMALPRSLGAGRSGRPDLGEKAEDLLAGMGDDP